MAQAAKDMNQVDDRRVEYGGVKKYDSNSAHTVARVGGVGLMDEEWNGTIEEHPDME